MKNEHWRLVRQCGCSRRNCQNQSGDTTRSSPKTLCWLKSTLVFKCHFRPQPGFRTGFCLAVVCLLLLSSSAALGQKKVGKNVRLVPRLSFPGENHRGALPALGEAEQALEKSLRRDVQVLAADIGERNSDQYEKLSESADFIEKEFKRSEYAVERQTFRVEGKPYWNLIVEIKGTTRAEQIVVIGAHYDSAYGAPGANDNASGVAGMLALARHFADKQPERTLRFVAFTNEEPPYFQTDEMGSLVYARRCKERDEKIVAMLALETIGYYSDEEESQKYPPPLSLYYPSTGNFIGFVGNVNSRPLVKETIVAFRKHAQFPSEGAALPSVLEGVGWSDHWSFWQVGYQGIMVTDTAPFRYPHYHTANDTVDQLDYGRLARVVSAMTRVVGDLASPKPVDKKKRKKFLRKKSKKKFGKRQ